ncbi:flagellar hook-associated protein FlgK [Proteiniclasticum sp. SCR006]|uniref:Flagellar hook-associated protein 1 n=1 Tax=Proteiniclasticum aestuarii TaxID=2817862 RepID=A0A939KJN4_9CLOT|nr:flagellar hook-associated protein FlgK [Proteiniclasticum aestuarii]MBO1265348.1 flagellar hook-associated protein FlgK [Proteiniclasticum aestuarii]
MSGLFGSFNVAVKGLNASQTALHTTGHNISNAGTEGFNRQRVEIKADTPYNLAGVGQLGTGVRIQSVVRVVDEFVDLQIRNENSIFSQFEAQYDTIGQIEMVFNEPSDTGLNFAMGEMFNAWQELSKNPESLNAKSIVVEKSKAFADSLNHMASRADQLKGDVVGNIGKNVFDVNSLVTQLNGVNEQIANIQIKGQSPNDLMDTRDQILKDLSGAADIETTFDKWGRASVSIAGQQVTRINGEGMSGQDNTTILSNVSAVEKNGDVYTVEVQIGGNTSKVEKITMTKDEVQNFQPGTPVFVKMPTDDSAPVLSDLSAANITSGAIGGHVNSIKEIEDRIEDLSKFATGVKYAFNSIHAAGASGEAFFTGDSALDFSVNEKLIEDEGLVNTGKGIESPDGDGSRALALANLRNVKLNLSEENLAGNNIYDDETMSFNSKGTTTTMEDAYGDIVIKVGVKTEQASNMMDNQTAVLSQLNNRRESVSGVSIDEEVTNLLKFQRSYEANSRVINTINEMLDTLINRTGV